MRVRNGILYITSPTKLSKSYIEDIIAKNFNSILKAMQDGEKIEDEIHFLGQLYKLHFVKSEKSLVTIEDQTLIVEAKDQESIPKLIEVFYNNALSKIVNTYSKEILNAFNLSFDVTFRYKNVKGYYGECFPKRKLIILSSKLAKYQLTYILSVIYHECAHFKYTNHQAEFYEYLESVYPNYRKVQQNLRKINYKDAY